MPIRAENKDRYPKDWKRIRAEILKRAKDRCEFCGVSDRALGYWVKDSGRVTKTEPASAMTEMFVRVPMCMAREPVVKYINGICRKIIRIVLTVAHLDHQPENCDPDNLRAFCQRCHNRHDAKTRADGRKRRRS